MFVCLFVCLFARLFNIIYIYIIRSNLFPSSALIYVTVPVSMVLIDVIYNTLYSKVAIPGFFNVQESMQAPMEVSGNR